MTVALIIGGDVPTTFSEQMWDNILLNVEPTLAVAPPVVVLVALGPFLVTELLRRKTT